MSNWQAIYESKLCAAQDAAASIRSGDVIAAAGVVCEPRAFFEALDGVMERLEDVTVVKSRSNTYRFLTDPAAQGHIRTLGHLFAKGLQDGYRLGLASYLPSDLSTFSSIRTKAAPNNVFAASVTEMDENGNLQIPLCQMYEADMLRCAKTVILEVNPRLRRVRGGLEISVARADMIYRADSPLTELPRTVPGPAEQKIAAYISEFIHDGDTVQLGLGKLPDAAAVCLREKNDLGLHSEMFTSSMAGLIKNGNITGRYKTLDRGEHVAAFALGDAALYDALADTPACRMAPCSYCNDPFNIMRQDNMKSVNTCMEIDLTGQVCSESIGPIQFSGTGGASDFAMGALRSKGGRGIIAFASTAKNGAISKIKSILTPGAVVSINRNLVDTVVTEYGVAELKGRSVRERALALIAIAHPDFRQRLTDEAREIKFI